MDTIVGILVGIIGALVFMFFKGARKQDVSRPKLDPEKEGAKAREEVMATDPHAVVQSLDDQSRSAIVDLTNRATDIILKRIKERSVHPGG